MYCFLVDPFFGVFSMLDISSGLYTLYLKELHFLFTCYSTHSVPVLTSAIQTHYYGNSVTDTDFGLPDHIMVMVRKYDYILIAKELFS